ncbi:hypothetical protein [Nesterenkonia sp. CF4.4]|uniref:hypothetical protein n=1 Tax=Nesterenkonia sp. CF4.4 TaxID=3373079 RepID=UPI003EE72324
MRGLLRHWDLERLKAEQATAAAVGTVLVNGAGGTQSIQRAQNFRYLGYPTCMLIDNDDRAIDGSVVAALAGGVAVHRWAFDNSLEDEIIQTLPIEGLQALVDLAADIRGEGSISNAVGARLSVGLGGTDVEGWQAQAGVDESSVRNAIAIAAATKRNEWFKREDRGEELAEVVIAHWDGLGDTHLINVIGELREFAYPSATGPIETDYAETPAHG